MSDEIRYITIDEQGYPTFWPLMWDDLGTEPSDDSVGLTFEQWEALGFYSWHCPRWKGDRHIIALCPICKEQLRQDKLMLLTTDAEIRLKETDYVVLKLYEDALGLNALTDDEKAKYQAVVKQRQEWRDFIAKANAEVDAEIEAEVAEDQKRYEEL